MKDLNIDSDTLNLIEERVGSSLEYMYGHMTPLPKYNTSSTDNESNN